MSYELDQAFEIVGLIRSSVLDLELFAADIQDTAVDQLVEDLRLATARLGDELARQKQRERRAEV